MFLQTLQMIMPMSGHAAARFLAPLTAAMNEFEINTSVRQAAFLAQLAHESGELARTEENLRYSPARIMEIFPRHVSGWADADKLSKSPERLANRVYASRNGNGDEASGDGYRYRGRGLIQLTGRDNYRLAASALHLPLLDQPELLTKPEHAARSAAWFWFSHGCNALADAGNFLAITKKINGGTNGYTDRCRYWARAKQALNIKEQTA